MKKSEECVICGGFTNNVRCINGHYVCDDCHTSGIDSVVGICMRESSCNPFEIIEKMMQLPTCHMHGPEHHVMVGASLITAYRNAGGDVDLEKALAEMVRRGRQVPGGACGHWGACGACVSTGMFISIITKSNPLAGEPWGLCNLMTSKALASVAETGGPRCCKRDSYKSILSAIDFVADNFGVHLQKPDAIRCTRSALNNQCIGEKCPFNEGN